MTGAVNYLEMSDEDFLKLPERLNGAAEEAAPVETPVVPETPAVVETPVVVDAPVVVPETPAVVEPKPDEVIPANPEGDKVNKPEGEDDAAPDLDAAPAPINYEELYKQITQPLKVKGKTIEIKSADDAIRLMQQGAGFGRKMQDIQPHLKTLRFLEQNHLLNVDQAELAYLVDLKNKNPDAIKKLVKESGIDPLDFNNEEPVVYRSNIPAVTDQQVVFREALDNLAVQDGGVETIAVCNDTWDAESHKELMKDPNLLEVIHDQRKHGFYDRIVSEMDRQKALGRIPVSTPFLAAYKQVGDHLRDTNGFADLIEKQRSVEKPVAPVPAQPQLLDTRVVAPKPSVTNNAQVKAAAATKSTPTKTAPLVNPLAMSDEEFMKQFGNKY